MTTDYNKTYPNPNDPPRNDVVTMQNNALAIYNIWDKDHYTFDAATPGRHQIVTFPDNVVPSDPGAGSAKSVIYTKPGVAEVAVSQAYFGNGTSLPSIAPIPLSAVRAFGVFNGTTAGAITPDLQVNVSGNITHVGAGSYLVNLVPGCTSGSKIGVIVSCGVSGSGTQLVCNYTAISITQISIRTFVASPFSLLDSANVTFVVLQI